MNKQFSRFALAAAVVVSLVACAKAPEVVVIPVVEDSVLTTNVKAALAAAPELKGVVLNVEAHAGVVQLSGVLDTYPQIDRALAITGAVVGVKSIEDKTSKKATAEAPAAAPAAAPEAAPAAAPAPAAK